jgi:hypothetical protein
MAETNEWAQFLADLSELRFMLSDPSDLAMARFLERQTEDTARETEESLESWGRRVDAMLNEVQQRSDAGDSNDQR